MSENKKLMNGLSLEDEELAKLIQNALDASYEEEGLSVSDELIAKTLSRIEAADKTKEKGNEEKQKSKMRTVGEAGSGAGGEEGQETEVIRSVRFGRRVRTIGTVAAAVIVLILGANAIRNNLITGKKSVNATESVMNDAVAPESVRKATMMTEEAGSSQNVEVNATESSNDSLNQVRSFVMTSEAPAAPGTTGPDDTCSNEVFPEEAECDYGYDYEAVSNDFLAFEASEENKERENGSDENADMALVGNFLLSGPVDAKETLTREPEISIPYSNGYSLNLYVIPAWETYDETGGVIVAAYNKNLSFEDITWNYYQGDIECCNVEETDGTERLHLITYIAGEEDITVVNGYFDAAAGELSFTPLW